jgi:hypothetical protein
MGDYFSRASGSDAAKIFVRYRFNDSGQKKNPVKSMVNRNCTMVLRKSRHAHACVCVCVCWSKPVEARENLCVMVLQNSVPYRKVSLSIRC